MQHGNKNVVPEFEHHKTTNVQYGSDGRTVKKRPTEINIATDSFNSITVLVHTSVLL